MNNTQKYIKFYIVKNRVEIYKDFAINLLYYIHKYYIDNECLNDDVDIRNHFVWCYNKVCDEFKKEGIDFSSNEELKEYYYKFYYHQFYRVVGNPNYDTSLMYYKNFWNKIFKIDRQNNNSIVSILIELYTIYDKSINKEKNIFEKI